MNRIDNSGTGIAGLGRNEDSMLAHVAPGEMVVPPVISPKTQQIIQQEMMSAGLDPNEYTVGEGMSINPITGMAEFGFLKKLGKSLKKVVKKIAPIAAIGFGIAGLGGVGPLSGLRGKGAASSTTGKFFGSGGKFRAGLGGLFGGSGGDTPTDQTGGSFFGMKTPDMIADITGSSNSRAARREEGGVGGLSPAMLAMAALYGKAVKEDYKKKEGGMKDIRQSIRPDLMPAKTFQGFDLGVRKNAAAGGLQELDMRMGGPSVGPGTGTSDDIAAMLSDGEFVMTSAANNGLGGFKVTKTETGLEMTPNGKPNRKKGAQNMDQLMKVFENYNDIGVA